MEPGSEKVITRASKQGTGMGKIMWCNDRTLYRGGESAGEKNNEVSISAGGNRKERNFAPQSRAQLAHRGQTHGLRERRSAGSVTGKGYGSPKARKGGQGSQPRSDQAEKGGGPPSAKNMVRRTSKEKPPLISSSLGKARDDGIPWTSLYGPK